MCQLAIKAINTSASFIKCEFNQLCCGSGPWKDRKTKYRSMSDSIDSVSSCWAKGNESFRVCTVDIQSSNMPPLHILVHNRQAATQTWSTSPILQFTCFIFAVLTVKSSDTRATLVFAALESLLHDSRRQEGGKMGFTPAHFCRHIWKNNMWLSFTGWKTSSMTQLTNNRQLKLKQESAHTEQRQCLGMCAKRRGDLRGTFVHLARVYATSKATLLWTEAFLSLVNFSFKVKHEGSIRWVSLLQLSTLSS